ATAAAATRFVEALNREPAFDQVVLMSDPAVRESLGRELFEQRFTLLFPLWLNARTAAYASSGGEPTGFSNWLARDAAKALEQFLITPEALAFADVIPSDPLLLLPGAVARLQEGRGFSAVPTTTLVWARLASSPLSEAGQAPVFAAIAQVSATVQLEHSQFAVAYTGVNRFAAASRSRIEREVTWLNIFSLLAVLTVAFTFIRRPHRGLHLLPVVGLSVLGAWVAATLVFDRLHIMVFVIGSLLTGVAIDYGFYLFMQAPAGPDEKYWAKVRRLTKPLLASCLTAVAGFSLLLFSDLPFIRQLGVFVGAGLVGALVAAVLYFSTVKNHFLETRNFRGGSALPSGLRRTLRRLLIALWIIALPGLAMLQWKDDIRELEIPSPELKQEYARLTALFGEEEGRTVYLTYGNNVSEARASLAKLEAWLDATSGGHSTAIGLGTVVPTVAAHTAAVDFSRAHPEFAGQLRVALIAAGFDDAEFAPFFAAYDHYAVNADASNYTTALDALQTKLTGPIGLLLHVGQPLSWFVTLVRAAPVVSPPSDTNTVTSGQLQTLNHVFSCYRQSALWLSLTGFALVGAGVFLTYGWRDGARIFAIPCGACLGIFGVFGWFGHPLNLFHLLGAFLGVCLTHNYSIFSATSAFRREPTPVSVRLSALTTAAAFGVLALSGIPVVRALGSTVSLMVLAALLVIELEHLSALGKKS
ncbi:MAG: MMPL family transporter, partial [Candidatus Didemnitutus sp.]|nr:MMPL family transporter [Candidatus Didemnitutus sp.]